MDSQQEARRAASGAFPHLEQRGVGAVEFVELLTCNRRLYRADDPPASQRGLADLSAGIRYYIDERELFTRSAAVHVHFGDVHIGGGQPADAGSAPVDPRPQSAHGADGP